MPAGKPGSAAPYHRSSVGDAWRTWFTTAMIVTTIWLITSVASGEFHYFWPIWVIGPWGAVLIASTITGGGRRRPGPDQRPQRRV